MRKSVITIQPASFVDQVVNGHECYKSPYPFTVDAEGYIQFQDFWQGTYERVIGLQRDVDVQTIDVWWENAFIDSDSLVGLYLVTEDSDGNWGTTPHAIESYYAGEIEV